MLRVWNEINQDYIFFSVLYLFLKGNELRKNLTWKLCSKNRVGTVKNCDRQSIWFVARKKRRGDGQFALHKTNTKSPDNFQKGYCKEFKQITNGKIVFTYAPYFNAMKLYGFWRMNKLTIFVVDTQLSFLNESTWKIFWHLF